MKDGFSEGVRIHLVVQKARCMSVVVAESIFNAYIFGIDGGFRETDH